MEKQIFLITGKQHHIRAIAEDLMELGYVIRGMGFEPVKNYKFDEFVITNQYLTPLNKKQYRGFVIVRRSELNPNFVIFAKQFDLPKNYTDVLHFCETQLKLWEDSKDNFKKGDWVVHQIGKINQCIGRFDKEYISNGKEFTKLTDTFYNTHPDIGIMIEALRPATDDEILNHILKQAKSRGLVEGAHYRPLYVDGTPWNSVEILNDAIYTYNSKHDCVSAFVGHGHIYANGKFAEVLKKPNIKTKFGEMDIELDVTEKLIITPNRSFHFNEFIGYCDVLFHTQFNLYRVVMPDENVIKIGCAVGTIKELREIYNQIVKINEKEFKFKKE